MFCGFQGIGQGWTRGVKGFRSLFRIGRDGCWFWVGWSIRGLGRGCSRWARFAAASACHWDKCRGHRGVRDWGFVRGLKCWEFLGRRGGWSEVFDRGRTGEANSLGWVWGRCHCLRGVGQIEFENIVLGFGEAFVCWEVISSTKGVIGSSECVESSSAVRVRSVGFQWPCRPLKLNTCRSLIRADN